MSDMGLSADIHNTQLIEFGASHYRYFFSNCFTFFLGSSSPHLFCTLLLLFLEPLFSLFFYFLFYKLASTPCAPLSSFFYSLFDFHLSFGGKKITALLLVDGFLCFQSSTFVDVFWYRVSYFSITSCLSHSYYLV